MKSDQPAKLWKFLQIADLISIGMFMLCRSRFNTQNEIHSLKGDIYDPSWLIVTWNLLWEVDLKLPYFVQKFIHSNIRM